MRLPLGQQGGRGWSPLQLGSSLLAWWDAERPDLITQSGGLVSSWRDVVGGYDAVQAVSASQPVWSATSFNGRPGATFDATDDDLTKSPPPASLPTGAAPGEIWLLTDQTALVADATTRSAGGYFGVDNTRQRRIDRIVSGGVNRAGVLVGDGSTTVTASNTTVDFSGRHVVRAMIRATEAQVDVDGVAGTPAAVVPLTASDVSLAIGRRPTSAGNQWSGTHNTMLYTGPLSADQATSLYAYLNRRL